MLKMIQGTRTLCCHPRCILAPVRDAIKKVLHVINTESAAFVSSPETVPLLCQRFKLSEADAYTWLLSTIWSSDYSIRLRGLENAKQALTKIGSVSADLDVRELCDEGLLLV